jgi:hypothetical protein
MNESQTEGMKRVRVDFNPSGELEIHTTKMRCAELIDEALSHKSADGSEAARNIETGCMYLVKALTSEVTI